MGVTHMALSSDSTCVHNLYSAQDGYETLHLTKEEDISNSGDSSSSSSHALRQGHARHPECLFPDWLQGKWEGLEVDGGHLSYRDATNFRTYRGRCVLAAVAAGRSGGGGDRYVVELDTGCGSATTNYCALFQQRDVNVMEFQLGKTDRQTDRQTEEGSE